LIAGTWAGTKAQVLHSYNHSGGVLSHRWFVFDKLGQDIDQSDKRLHVPVVIIAVDALANLAVPMGAVGRRLGDGRVASGRGNMRRSDGRHAEQEQRPSGPHGGTDRDQVERERWDLEVGTKAELANGTTKARARGCTMRRRRNQLTSLPEGHG